MKRQSEYIKNHRLSYQIAGIMLIIATVGFTLMYFYQKNVMQRQEAKQESLAEEESQSVSGTVEPKTSTVDMEALQKERYEASLAERDSQQTAEQSVIEQVAETSAITLHFPDELTWPVDGKVLIDYSMEQTVYFKTLQQYQCNPALIIGAEVNDEVVSACAGKITSILNDAKTGTTVTMDLGDGYEAVYGQLKEIPVATGEYVAAGQCIGYISQPSKYYSAEGANLYSELRKDGNPVNPQDFLQQ